MTNFLTIINKKNTKLLLLFLGIISAVERPDTYLLTVDSKHSRALDAYVITQYRSLQIDKLAEPYIFLTNLSKYDSKNVPHEVRNFINYDKRNYYYTVRTHFL